MFDPLPECTDTVRVELGERSYDILIGTRRAGEIFRRAWHVSWA